MASSQNDTQIVGATQVILSPLGASIFPTKISFPSISGGQMKLDTLGSGATVQFFPNYISGSTVGGATNVALKGWGIATADAPYYFLGPASFYVGSAGATSVLAFLLEYPSGNPGATLV